MYLLVGWACCQYIKQFIVQQWVFVCVCGYCCCGAIGVLFSVDQFFGLCSALVWFGLVGQFCRAQFRVAFFVQNSISGLVLVFFIERVFGKRYTILLLKERKKAEIYTNILVSIDSKCKSCFKVLFFQFWLYVHLKMVLNNCICIEKTHTHK